MTQIEIVPRQEMAELTEDNVRALLFSDKTVQPTQTEVRLFIELCIARGLNPWLREAHLIKYANNQPASIVVGKDAFIQRANMIPAYDGMSAGVIVQRGDAIEYVEGSFAIPGVDVLVGGWAKVFHKNRTVPTYQAVSLKEYHSGQSSWTKMPLTMIRKVAIVQALREAFPHDFTGMYDASEMQQAVVDVDIVSETGQSVTPESVMIPENIGAPNPQSDTVDTRVITDKQRDRLFAILNAVRKAVPSADLSDEAVKSYMEDSFGKGDSSTLTRTEYDQLINWIEEKKVVVEGPSTIEEDDDEGHF